MSLIVARRIDNEVRIITDTKITDDLILHQTLLGGKLKCVVVSPTCCVCFAGIVALAEEALSPILDGEICDRQRITTHLLQHHRASKGEIDFIVASLDEPVAAIDRITEGELEMNLISAWIGDQPAFNTYQRCYHADLGRSAASVSLEESFEIASRMSDAFKAVIEDHRHASVGDFALTVTSRPAQSDGFRYLCRAGAFGFRSVSNTTTPTSLLQSLGAEGGSFHYTVLVPTIAGVGAVAVHLLEGKVGAFFYPAQCWSPTVFKNVGVDQFVQAIARRFGVNVDGVRHY